MSSSWSSEPPPTARGAAWGLHPPRPPPCCAPRPRQASGSPSGPFGVPEAAVLRCSRFPRGRPGDLGPSDRGHSESHSVCFMGRVSGQRWPSVMFAQTAESLAAAGSHVQRGDRERGQGPPVPVVRGTLGHWPVWSQLGLSLQRGYPDGEGCKSKSGGTPPSLPTAHSSAPTSLSPASRLSRWGFLGQTHSGAAENGHAPSLPGAC